MSYTLPLLLGLVQYVHALALVVRSDSPFPVLRGRRSLRSAEWSSCGLSRVQVRELMV